MDYIKQEGPWVEGFVIKLDSQLKSKSNFRRGSNWSKYVKYEKDLALTIKEVLPYTWDLGSRDNTINERPKVVIQIVAESLIDTGNLSKSVLDALEGVLYHNDASVVAVASMSIRKKKGYTYIGVARLRPDASFEEVQNAVRELNIRCTDVCIKIN
ncbi:MAG: RusA family crossover junction endodeoxyribonuclease [Candidatus Paceibacterota bacterium]